MYKPMYKHRQPHTRLKADGTRKRNRVVNQSSSNVSNINNITINVTNSGTTINNLLPNASNGYMPNSMFATGLNQFIHATPQISFHQNQFDALASNPQFPFHQNQLCMHASNQMNTQHHNFEECVCHQILCDR